MKSFLIFLGLLICISCKEEKIFVYQADESKALMVDRITDMYVMDTWVARTSNLLKDSMKTKLQAEFQEVHGISFEDFELRLESLQEDPNAFADVMDSVLLVLKDLPQK